MPNFPHKLLLVGRSDLASRSVLSPKQALIAFGARRACLRKVLSDDLWRAPRSEYSGRLIFARVLFSTFSRCCFVNFHGLATLEFETALRSVSNFVFSCFNLEGCLALVEQPKLKDPAHPADNALDTGLRVN